MDDWLKYNSSEYTVNGVTYRNLEAQVLKNKRDIEELDVSGLERDVEALQGSVAQIESDVATKQDALTAGANITISSNNVISAQNTTYEAGTGIEIVNNVISATGADAEIETYYGFTSGLSAYNSGMTPTASLPTGVTAQDLYDAYTAGKAVALVDSAGVVAFVYSATLNSGTYTVNVKGFGSYNPSTFPSNHFLGFDGRVTSNSPTFTKTTFTDPATRIKRATRTLYSADWDTTGTNPTNSFSIETLLTTDLVWVSPAPASAIDYADSNIVCTAQYGTGSSDGGLGFTAYGNAPTSDIVINVAWTA